MEQRVSNHSNRVPDVSNKGMESRLLLNSSLAAQTKLWQPVNIN